ncbi:beta-microseminoprotein [Etheostoma spectabile]|uniref:beta-microseminoprotein n=1 Tax=Etheostoma spectabile TaxID=54343 RepID=UPI0013AEA9AF|nr:beta-microseminoprotein-like [Etheostoma spectabile]
MPYLSWASFHVFLCLLGLVVLCHSDSFFQKLELKDLKNPPKGCVDKDGKQHDFGSEWDRDCMACSCTSEGLSCSSKMPNANTVDISEDCELVVDKDACSAKVVMKSDKTKECNPV